MSNPDFYVVDGKEFSVATVKAATALWELVNKKSWEVKPKTEPEPYIFKAGDVARSDQIEGIRIIFKKFNSDELSSISPEGREVGTYGQAGFEGWGYVPTGKHLADYLPKDE